MFIIALIIGAVVASLIRNWFDIPAPLTWLIGGIVAAVIGGGFSAANGKGSGE